jgi:uncharacterized small protein (DUF1192 family)
MTAAEIRARIAWLNEMLRQLEQAKEAKKETRH